MQIDGLNFNSYQYNYPHRSPSNAISGSPTSRQSISRDGAPPCWRWASATSASAGVAAPDPLCRRPSGSEAQVQPRRPARASRGETAAPSRKGRAGGPRSPGAWPRPRDQLLRLPGRVQGPKLRPEQRWHRPRLVPGHGLPRGLPGAGVRSGVRLLRVWHACHKGG